jgi:hypothetical protein
MWEQEGLWFALLKKSDLAGAVEKLAHVGLIFDTGAEFDAEIQRRSIDPERVNALPGDRGRFSCRTRAALNGSFYVWRSNMVRGAIFAQP